MSTEPRAASLNSLAVWLAAIMLVLMPVGAELARTDTFDLAAIQIDDQDVPSGYIPLDNKQLATLGLAPEFLDQQSKARSHVRAWVHPDSGRGIVAFIVEERSGRRAVDLGRGMVSELEKSALRRLRVPEISNARGFVKEEVADGTLNRVFAIIFRRDRLVFILYHLAGDGSTEEELIVRGLAVRQEAKAPIGGSDLDDVTTRLATGIIANLVGVIALYIFVVNRVARRRDPLRPPKVTLEQGIKLLQTQIAKGQKLLSCRPISLDNYKAWELRTRRYLEKAFGSDFEQYDIGISRSFSGDPAFPRDPEIPGDTIDAWDSVDAREDPKLIEWWENKRAENLQANLKKLEGLVEVLATEAQRRDERRRLMQSGGRPGVVDVTPVARGQQSKALRRHVLRLVAVLIALPGLIPFLWPQSLFLVPLGWGVGYGPTLWQWLWQHRSRRARGRRLFTGSRPVRVTLLVTGATVLMMAGLFFIFTSGAFSTWAVGEDEEGLRNLWLLGLGLIVIGTSLYTLARRLAALSARELLRRDTRPVMLYLRAFADDDLKLRTATYNRPSLIERLSPRRFDRFEEVIARHLGDLGPVIAVNPPGISLPPLGAARETLSDKDWQRTVARWMAEAQLILVQAAPPVVTEGLAWELQSINAQGLWPKTLFVLPPVPAALLRARWRRFAGLLGRIGASELALPADPVEVLTAVWSHEQGWLVFVADARNEWTYAAALMEVATQLKEEDQDEPGAGNIAAISPNATG
jgi:hypothetical protein